MFCKTNIKLKIPLRYTVYKSASNLTHLVEEKINEICSYNTHAFPIYLGFNNLKISDKIYLQQNSLNVLDLEVMCTVYYYDIVPSEMILVKVTDK